VVEEDLSADRNGSFIADAGRDDSNQSELSSVTKILDLASGTISIDYSTSKQLILPIRDSLLQPLIG